MQTVEIIITNVLPTGTAFAVCAHDMTQVFISSAVAERGHVEVGLTMNAHIVPNFSHPERTPWQAVKILELTAPTPLAAAQDTDMSPTEQLIAEIEALLADADYPDTELAAEIGADLDLVQDTLGVMQSAGRVRAYYVYELIQRGK
jgi:hypothetical protein